MFTQQMNTSQRKSRRSSILIATLMMMTSLIEWCLNPSGKLRAVKDKPAINYADVKEM